MTLDELTTPLTTAEVRAKIYAALAARGVSTTGWKSGGVTRTIIESTSIVLAAFSRLQALIAKSGFLETSEGDWLTLVARYVYGVERNEGSFATGTVTLTNTGGGVYSGDAGDLVFSNSETGKTYRNTAAFSIGALEEDVEVSVQAEELGTDSNASPGAIDAFVTPLVGVTVTNEAAVVGADPETDAALRARALLKTGALSPNGARDAYVYVATTAERADGTSIGVTRVRTIADGDGNVDVYLATAAGAVQGDAEDLETDLGVINEAIQTQVVPLGVTAVVQSAAAAEINVTYELWVENDSGYTDAEIQDLIEERLIDFMASQPIGGHVLPSTTGKVYVSAIRAVIGAVLPDDIIRVDVTLPAADFDLDVDEAPKAGAIVATAIHQISRSAV
jgi:phage-related baseplate assembly protein